MCLVYSKKNHPKIKFSLLFFILFLIIIMIYYKYNNLFAQGKERDPFLSLGDKIKLSQKVEDVSVLPYPIILNGIVWTEHLPIAIINNEIVQEGDIWRDFKVEKIDKDKVILRRGDAQFEIPLVSKEEDVAKKD